MKKIITILFLISTFIVNSQGVIKPSWSLLGNATSTNNFFGTTNSQPLVFKTNNTERFKIESTGEAKLKTKLAIGNSTVNPSRELDVHNLTGTASMQAYTEDATLFSGVYAQANNLSYYACLNHCGSTFSVANQWYRPNSAILDLSSPTSAIINGVGNGSIQFGVGSFSTSSEKMKITTNSITITPSLSVGNATVNPSALGIVRIGQGTSFIDLGQNQTNFPSIWFQKTTPSTTNYLIAEDANSSYINGTSSIIFNTGGTGRGIWNSTGLRIGSTTAANVALAVTGSGSISTTFTVSGNLTGQSNISSTSKTAGIGYAVGSGSTTTQLTSRTTGVTINAITGSITLFSAAGLATWQSFTVTNSAVEITDVITLVQRSGTDLYMIEVTNVVAGSFIISYATTGGTTVEQPVFNYAVIKGKTN